MTRNMKNFSRECGFLEDESLKSLATLVAEGGHKLKGRVIQPWKTSSRGWTGPLIA